MKVVKINFSDEQYEKVKRLAEENGMSIQDLIRSQFISNNTIFTSEEAVRRIKSGAVNGMEKFTLPDVYGDDWTLKRGPAGAFGKAFYNFITLQTEHKIRYIAHGSDGRRAEYCLEK